AATVCAAVEELSDYLIGQDPAHIEDLWTVMYRGGFYRGGPILMSAIAGIDQALWDIKGKAHDLPVHQLLGGRVRDRIGVYSWIGGDRPAETATQAKDAVARGFTAVKMNGTEEMAFIDSWDKVTRAVENVATIREAVGDDIGVAVDFHGRVHAPMAKVLIRELEPFHLMFIEEPCSARTSTRCSTPCGPPPPRSPSGSACTPAGTSSTCWPAAPSTSSSPTPATAAASPRPARSPRWPRPTTWPWRCTAPWDRSPWPPACRSTPGPTTPSSRSRAWASITTPTTTCSTTWWTAPSSTIGTAWWPSRPGRGWGSRSTRTT